MTTQTWSNWNTNPFHAIKECALARNAPADYDKAKQVLLDSLEWPHIEHRGYLKAVLQDVFAETLIAVEIEDSTEHGVRYRAAYESVEIIKGVTYIGAPDFHRCLGTRRTVLDYDTAFNLVTFRNEVGDNPPEAYVSRAVMSTADFIAWATGIEHNRA